MKAVIVEIRENYVAALSDDGCIVRLKNKNYTVGQVIYVKKEKKSYLKFAARIAGTAAVVAIATISAWAYYTPYSYVSLDVNPSIEYSLNRFDYVIDCTAVNGDGEEILENLNLRNKNIEKAIKATVKEITAQGYLSENELGGIVITASCTDEEKADELAQELEEDTQEAIQEENVDADIIAEGVGAERVAEARELGVTPGKLNLVQKLQASVVDDEEIVVEEWLDRPVKEIMKQIKENRKGNNPSADENNEDNQNEGENSDPSENQEQEKNKNKNKNKNNNQVTGNDANEGNTFEEQEQEQEEEHNANTNQNPVNNSEDKPSDANGNGKQQHL